MSATDCKMDVNGHPVIEMGQTLVCSVTGKEFIAARDGCSFNYAWSQDGKIVSDEGVDIWERNQLRDHSKPFYAYVSSDGRHITGWKGNILGTITSATPYRLTRMSYTHGKTINSYTMRDVHGHEWYGRGNPGVAIKLRAYGARAHKAA